MRPPFKRTRWIYLMLLGLVLWPLVLHRLQRIPKLDPRTVKALAGWIDKDPQAKLGPSIISEFNAVAEHNPLFGNAQDKSLEYTALNTRLANMGYFSVPSLAPEISSLSDQLDPAVKNFAALGSKGGDYERLAPLLLRIADEKTSTPHAEELATQHPKYNYIAAQAVSLIERERAALLWRSGNGSAARKLLDVTAAYVDATVLTKGLTGNMLRVGCRMIMLAAYRSALNAEPHTTEDRANLEALVALRVRDPRITPFILEMQQRLELDWRLNREQPGAYELQADLMEVCVAIARDPEAIQNSGSRRWAERRRRLLRSDTNVEDRAATLLVKAQYEKQWTTAPAAVQFARRAIEGNPSVMAENMFPAEVRKGLDPWTLAILGTDAWQAKTHLAQELTSSRIAITQGRLLEVAFAARAYAAEHQGTWPDKIDDLISGYLPADSLDPAQQDQPDAGLHKTTGPYLPYHMAWLPGDEATRVNIWNQNVSLRAMSGFKLTSQTLSQVPPPGPAEWIAEDQSVVVDPLAAVAFAEELRAHAKLVGSAQSWYRMKKNDAWLPLDEKTARRMHDDLLEHCRQLGWRGAYPTPPANDELYLRNQLTSQLPPNIVPQALRVTAEVKEPPQRVLTAWSAGPDGIDEGGRVVFGQDKSQTMAGDLVDYPEGY